MALTAVDIRPPVAKISLNEVVVLEEADGALFSGLRDICTYTFPNHVTRRIRCLTGQREVEMVRDHYTIVEEDETRRVFRTRGYGMLCSEQ